MLPQMGTVSALYDMNIFTLHFVCLLELVIVKLKVPFLPKVLMF